SRPRGTAVPGPAPTPPPVLVAPPKVPPQELAQLKFLLRSKQRAISDLEEFRSRQLTELRTAIEQQRVIYNKNHPVMLELEQRLESLQKDSPQLLTLKRDELELQRDI